MFITKPVLIEDPLSLEVIKGSFWIFDVTVPVHQIYNATIMGFVWRGGILYVFGTLILATIPVDNFIDVFLLSS